MSSTPLWVPMAQPVPVCAEVTYTDHVVIDTLQPPACIRITCTQRADGGLVCAAGSYLRIRIFFKPGVIIVTSPPLTRECRVAYQKASAPAADNV